MPEIATTSCQTFRDNGVKCGGAIEAAFDLMLNGSTGESDDGVDYYDALVQATPEIVREAILEACA